MFIYPFIVAVVVLGTFTRLPLGSSYMFVYVAFLPMIAPAGETVLDLSRLMRGLGGVRYILLAAFGLCAVATVSLGIAGCILDQGVDVPVPVSGVRCHSPMRMRKGTVGSERRRRENRL